MDTFNFPSKSEIATDAAEAMAGQVASSAANLLDATKAAGRKIGAVAQEEVTSLRTDLDDLVSRVSSLSEFELIAAKEKLLAKIETTKAAAKGVSADVSRRFNRGVANTTDYVVERPLQSVAVAAGIGILMGMLISRR